MEFRSLFTKMFGSKKDTSQQMTRYQLVSTADSSFYPWNGKLFENDIVRSCIRPKSNAVGKLSAKHLKGKGSSIKINAETYIKQILENPNQYMSMQDFLSKMVIQRELTHNAFAYIERDMLGYPIAVYPVPYSGVELYEQGQELYIKFRFWTGKYMTVPYTERLQ